MTLKDRIKNLVEKWFYWHEREIVYTSVRYDLGSDDTTPSGSVEISRPAKQKKDG